MEISVGIKVAVRGLEWDVVQVEQLGPVQRLRLACTQGDLQGLEWDVLYPPEDVIAVRDDPRPEDIGPLDAWIRFHIACLLDQIPGPHVPPGRLTIEPYQRVPLLRALGMARPRLMLADGVGLGKTIQAGLIAAELIIRRRGHRILIVSPPGPLLRQWEQEMRLRFGLRFTSITDAASLRDARRGLELGTNPFDSTALCLTSMDFAKQDRVLAELERATWDLVIIDEAHHCIGDSSQRRVLAEVLARQSDGLLLLTATPHDGHDAHFASLIALLDPSLVDGRGRLIGNQYRRHVVRRLKSHIRDTRTGVPLFRERRITPVKVDVTNADTVRAFHKALSALVAPRLRQSRDRAGLANSLAFVSLLKRSMSTIAACVATLRVVASRYSTPRGSRRERQRALQAWRRKVARYGVLDAYDEAEYADLEAEAMAADLAGEKTAAALADLIRLGEAAAAHDPKLAALVLEVRLIRIANPGANILVYTEYADSQSAAVEALAAIGGTLLTIGGADSEADRSRAAERCASEDNIILVSTDSLAEGLNLQQRCHHLIHLDLPYNPNRLEQRNGRIDRYGQRHDPEIRYLYLAGTFEDRLLLHLIAKYEKARVALSVMPQMLAVSADPQALREPLLAGFAENLFSGQPRLVHSLDLAAEDEDGVSYRELLREIDRAFQSFDRAAVQHGWMAAQSPPVEQGDPDLEQSPIDVPAFVASVLPAAAGGHRVPPDWRQDLDGLPGFDPVLGVVRLAGDPAQERDDDGRTLLFPGRSHLLTRRVIATARADRSGRVSAAAADIVSVLVTYMAEAGMQYRKVIGLKIRPDGAVTEASDVLSFAQSEATTKEPWKRYFADWATAAIAAAARQASAVANRLFATFSEAHHLRVEQEAATALNWLRQRAVDLCGPPRPLIDDLFQDSGSNDWISIPAPDLRLALFAADPSVPASDRREASEALSRYRSVVGAKAFLPPLSLRPIGLLMLCP